MEIAVVSDLIFPVIGGAERRIVEIYKRLAKKHKVTFYTTKNTVSQVDDLSAKKGYEASIEAGDRLSLDANNIDVK
ncbi:MAG: hypothetical protein KAR35_06180 [Candidatus Heimdallarchaeota archaeon]|nr:hypothetical protein [Candidatus Heimdallarchaeota archaeon]MCK5048946.1 hypothetical protein [Candidatus Heimdallarchaeota archaeon]